MYKVLSSSGISQPNRGGFVSRVRVRAPSPGLFPSVAEPPGEQTSGRANWGKSSGRFVHWLLRRCYIGIGEAHPEPGCTSWPSFPGGMPAAIPPKPEQLSGHIPGGGIVVQLVNIHTPGQRWLGAPLFTPVESNCLFVER